MSKIDELLKGEKVEWKKIGDIKDIKVISPIKKINKKEYLDEGLYPIIDQGQKFIVGYTNDENATFEKNKYVVFGDHTESLKYIDFQFAQGADGIKVLKTNEEYLNSRYFYHAILNFYEMKGNYMRHFSLLKKTEIPIPSIETQEKIVEILDKFTECVTELQAELQARVKQYEYYRDELLSEDYLNKLTKEFYSLDKFRVLDYVKISELCLRQRGIKITAEQMKNLDREDSSVRVFAGGNTTANLSPEEVGVENIINKPSVIVKSRGNIDFEYYDQPFTHKNEMWSYSTLNEDNLNIKYLYYVLKNNLKYFTDNAISGKLPQIATGVTDNYKIPLPNILVQNIVVEILDKFQSLVSETKGLLPQEIEQRQKQYEYYREKLLTFDENMIERNGTIIS